MPPTHSICALILVTLLGGQAFTAEAGLNQIATAPAAVKKGELLFSDDFSAPALAKTWRILWPELSVADDVLKISQAKPEHSAVGMVPVGRKDVIISFKFKLGAASSINAVCNDRDYKEGHGGHICRVSLSSRQIFLADDKVRLRQEIEEMKNDPARRTEAERLVAGCSQSVPLKLDPARWYELTMEIVGEEMHASLDGKPVGHLRSSGLAHPMKSDLYFAVSGENAFFDDVRIWAARPVDPK